MTAPVVLIAPAMAIGSGYYRPLVEELESRGWEARALPRRGFESDGQYFFSDTASAANSSSAMI